MPKPTTNALSKHPKAVVMAEIQVNDLHAGIANRDFEWFDTDEGVTIFRTDAYQWAQEDVKAEDGGDLVHVIATFSDTKDLTTVSDVVVVAPKGVTAKDVKAIADYVRSTPSVLIQPVQPARKVKPKPAVKGRKQGEAAKVVKGDQAGEAPQPKAAKARKAAQKDRAAALKERLGGQKVKPVKGGAVVADADADVTAEPEAPLVNAFGTMVQPLGWQIPVGRRRNGRFARLA